MKTLLLITVICLTAVGGAFAQTASFAFNDNNGAATAGTYNPTDTFTLSLAGTISGMGTGFTTNGYSLWIEAPTGIASNLSITGATFFQFTNQTQPNYPKAFNDASGADPGFLTARDGILSGDLGATTQTSAQATGNGTFHLADYTFSLSGVAPGTYTIFTTTVNPKQSGISFDDGVNFPPSAFAGAAAYTITVVPEPATWSLLAFGGVASAGLTWLRARRHA